MADEKTEKATPKRRRDERKKGNIFQSKEVVTVLSLIVGFYGVKLLGSFMVSMLEKAMKDNIFLAGTVEELTTADAVKYLMDAGVIFAAAALPILLICGFVSILATVAQTRGIFNMSSAAPKFNRLNPLEGIKKMFAIRGVVELLKSLAKIAVLGSYQSFLENSKIPPKTNPT